MLQNGTLKGSIMLPFEALLERLHVTWLLDYYVVESGNALWCFLVLDKPIYCLEHIVAFAFLEMLNK